MPVTLDKPRAVAPHIHAIALDETADFDHGYLDDILAKHGARRDDLLRIEVCYYYDSNERTRLCEFTPSYALYAYDSRPIWRDGFEVPDALDEELSDDCRDTITAYSGGDLIYVHCSTVDSIVERLRGEPFRYHDEGISETWHLCDDGSGRETYEMYMDWLYEAFSSNAPV